MGPLQRMKLGLTIPQLVARGRKLKAAGVDVTAEALMGDWLGDNGAAAGVGADWDAILAFIEKLLPIILKLIELFS
jgi:hypothetical protein